MFAQEPLWLRCVRRPLRTAFLADLVANLCTSAFASFADVPRCGQMGVCQSVERGEEQDETGKVAQLRAALADQGVQSKLQLTPQDKQYLCEQYAANEGKGPPPNVSAPQTHTVKMTYFHPDRHHAAFALYSSSGRKTSPLSIAMGNGFWLERAALPDGVRFNVFETRKLEGGASSDERSILPGDKWEILNQSGMNTKTFFQGGCIDTRLPEKTFVTLKFHLPDEKGRDVTKGFFDVAWRQEVTNGGWGIQWFMFELVEASAAVAEAE